MIVACGDYTGGALRYVPQDDGKTALEVLDGAESETVDAKCKPFYFDGSKAHGTETFQLQELRWGHLFQVLGRRTRGV